MKSSTSLDFVRWAREQPALRSLTRSQSQVLTQLATFVDRRGECFVSTRVIASGAVISERHAQRVLGELGRLGLVSTRLRGRGRAAARRLCCDAAMPAPPCPRGTLPLFDAALTPAAPVAGTPPIASPVTAAVTGSAPPSETSAPPSDVRQKEQGLGREEETRCARPALEHDPLVDRPLVVAPRLDDVLSILAGVPALNGRIESYMVNSTLLSMPEAAGYDHLRAAGYVAQRAFEDGAHGGAAHARLAGALRNQHRAAAAGPCGRGGRRRPAAPVMDAQVAATFERAGENLRAWMKDAGFGRGA